MLTNDWACNSNHMTQYCPAKADTGLLPVIRKGTTPFVVHLQTLDLIPSGAGFPARYASTIIWRKGMSYPLEPPFLGCGRKRGSLNSRSTLATPFFRHHLATLSSLRRASIHMRMRRRGQRRAGDKRYVQNQLPVAAADVEGKRRRWRVLTTLFIIYLFQVYPLHLLPVRPDDE